MPSLAEHQQQRALLDQLHASSDPQAQQQAAQLQNLYHDREMAGLADDVYEAAKGQGRPEPGWIRASENLDKLREYAPQLNMTDEQLKEFLHPKRSGFRAEIYLPDPAVLGPGYKPTVVFKGSSGEVLTPDGLRETTGEDFLANNFPQSVGLRTDYYDRAMELASALKAQRMDFELAGHSLGGGMASAAAAVTGVRTTTLNAAGLHPATAQRFAQENGLPVYDTQKTVVAYQVAGEVLNDGIQQNIHRLDAFRREELGAVLRETSVLLKDLPQGKALLASQLDASVPRYAQPSVHAFLDRLEQGDTAQLLRELPLAAGQPQPLLAAKRREHPDDPSSGPIDRERHLSLREVSNFAGPALTTLALGAQGAQAGLHAGQLVDAAGRIAGQGLDKAGDATRSATQLGANASVRATHAVGEAAAGGVLHAAAAAASVRQGLGHAAADVDRLQGEIQSGAALLGSGALRQAARMLPEGLREQADAQAERLAQSAAQAQQRQQAEGAQALHAAGQDAQRLREVAHGVAQGIEARSERLGQVQHAAIAGAGAVVDGALDSTARQTQHIAAQAPAVSAGLGAAVSAGTAANVQYNPLFATSNVVNVAGTSVLAREVGPSAKEATDRHLMTETVVPSLDARIQDIEHKARQHVAPEQGGPHAPAAGASTRERDAQDDHTPTLPRESAPPRAATAVSSLPMDLRDPAHPGHAEFKHSLREVHYMEAGQGIASGPHSEKVAAALLLQGEREGLRITNVTMGADGQVQGLQRFSAFDTPKMERVDPRQAQSVEMHDYASQWAQLRSPHLVGQAAAAERTAEQAQGLVALSAADQAMFARIRRDVPAHIGDEHVAQAMLSAKQAGIADAGKIDRVLMAGDELWVAGATPGFRAATDVSQPSAPMQDTVQQTQALNQQREQQLAMEIQQRQQEGPGGRSAPVMS